MKDLNKHFSKDTKMTKKHMKKSITSLITREMHIKFIMIHTVMPSKMAIKKQKTNLVVPQKVKIQDWWSG
jgi:hypothetical protein